jgi:hypothetical protein
MDKYFVVQDTTKNVIIAFMFLFDYINLIEACGTQK